MYNEYSALQGNCSGLLILKMVKTCIFCACTKPAFGDSLNSDVLYELEVTFQCTATAVNIKIAFILN
jgi:hypothetical protein